VGLFRAEAAEVEDSPAADVPSAGLGTNTPGIPSYRFGAMTRAQALRVPAFRRAVTLIAGAVSQLRFATFRPDGSREDYTTPFLRQPDPGRTLEAVLYDVVADLCLYGNAYLWNYDGNTPDGWRYAGTGKRKHRVTHYVPVEEVSVLRTNPGDLRPPYYLTYLGKYYQVPASHVIAFEAPMGGWLKDGSDVLATSVMLDEAVRLYASQPVPQQVIKNTGARRTPEQVDAMIASLEAARRQHSTAYVGRDLDLSTFGWNADEIALTEARQQNVLDIARLTGIPAHYLGASVEGSSLTYSNLSQVQLDLQNAAAPYAHAIESRLSFDDVTGEGTWVELDWGPSLRTDPMMRANLYEKLIPLGVMTVEEARAFESFAGYLPIPGTPSTEQTPATTPPGTPGMPYQYA